MQKSIGLVIRDRREAAGLTQADLARRVKSNPQVINRIEQGVRSDPRWSTIARIAVVLGCSLDVMAREAGHAIPIMSERNIESALAEIVRELENMRNRLSSIRTRTKSDS